MDEQIKELPGLKVDVTDVVFMPTLEAPPERPYPFVYFISLQNGSDQGVTIRARKWVVRQGDGEFLVVEGEGVVGQFPRIEPGETFSYNSYHTINVDSEAEGAFFGEADGGELIFVRIPSFSMHVPQWA